MPALKTAGKSQSVQNSGLDTYDAEMVLADDVTIDRSGGGVTLVDGSQPKNVWQLVETLGQDYGRQDAFHEGPHTLLLYDWFLHTPQRMFCGCDLS
jgi:hypothetical protein